ncbi:MAG: acyl-CoA dehydrogenase family protein [Geminicoccaceae bacterium]
MMMSRLDRGRVGIAGMCVGILQAALDAAVGQAKIRRQFGQPIADFQAVQFLLADIAKDLHAARRSPTRPPTLLDTGEAATSLLIAALRQRRRGGATSDALQIFGGSGYIRGFEVERPIAMPGSPRFLEARTRSSGHHRPPAAGLRCRARETGRACPEPDIADRAARSSAKPMWPSALTCRWRQPRVMRVPPTRWRRRRASASCRPRPTYPMRRTWTLRSSAE